MSDYFIIRNSEDGLRIRGPLDQQEALNEIAEETSEDLQPKYRATFTNTPPDEYTDPKKLFILRGEVVIPEPVERVTEYRL